MALIRDKAKGSRVEQPRDNPVEIFCLDSCNPTCKERVPLSLSVDVLGKPGDRWNRTM